MTICRTACVTCSLVSWRDPMRFRQELDAARVSLGPTVPDSLRRRQADEDVCSQPPSQGKLRRRKGDRQPRPQPGQAIPEQRQIASPPSMTRSAEHLLSPPASDRFGSKAVRQATPLISGARLGTRSGTSGAQAFRPASQDLPTRYRAYGRHPASEIGSLLGFSEPSAFSRWHRGRFGASARQAGLGSVASSPS